MMLQENERKRLLLGILTAAATGCTGADQTDSQMHSSSGEVVGNFLPGIDPALLEEATQAFAAVEGIADGVGPIFNERSCGGCHDQGAPGGAGEVIERRFGRFVNGIFDPLAARGGTLRQLFTVGNFNNPSLPVSSRGQCQAGNATLCCVPVEVEPPEATVRNVGRLTTPLFGLGLVDAMPDAFFDQLAAAQPPAIRGIVNRVPVILPNPGDPTQGYRTTRVGRFGWKAAIPNLMQFSADAYNNEMGITTQSCFRGASLNDFALENAPNAPNGSLLDGCDDLALRQPPAFAAAVGLAPAHAAQVDDAVGSCTGGRTEIQDDVFLFTVFMTALAPLPRDARDALSISRGEPLFTQVGCAGCHVTTTFRTPSAPPPIDIGQGVTPVRVPGDFTFNPYSDFLKHDMGTLGDHIGEAPPDDPPAIGGDTVATTRQMRTAPLWGIRFRNRLLHDGRTTDIGAAVSAHDGQAAPARDAFNALSSTDRHALIAFVRSL